METLLYTVCIYSTASNVGRKWRMKSNTLKADIDRNQNMSIKMTGYFCTLSEVIPSSVAE